MKEQRQRIDDLMKKHKIDTHTDLLKKILNKIEKGNVYEEIKKQKANFSKMINGERNFNYEYIAPLEDILETKFSYIINGTEYNSEFVNKGLRFAAFQNNYKEFERLDDELCKHGNPIFNTDEFGKNIINYILENDSIEGLRYLTDKYNFKYNIFNNSMFCENKPLFIGENEIIKVLELICKNDEADIFNKLFNGFEIIKVFEHIKGYDENKVLYFSDDFKHNVLTTKLVLKSLMSEVECMLKDVNYGLISNDEVKYLFVNPFLNIILDYALQNPQIYNSSIVEILKFAKTFNKKQIDRFLNEYNLNFLFSVEDGYVKYGQTIYGNLIVVPEVYSPKIDSHIKNLIDEVTAINVELTTTERYDYLGRRLYRIDQNYLYKKHSDSELEYKIYEKFNNCKIDGLLEYKSTEFGVDKFKKIQGSNEINVLMCSDDKVKEIARFLREFHFECKNKFNNKVCVNNNLNINNILFNNNKLTAVVDWSKCSLEDDGFNDLFDILLNWTGMSDRFRNNEDVLRKVEIVLKEYFENNKVVDFCDKFKIYLLSRKNLINCKEKEIEFEKISWAITFVEIYEGDIDKITKGEN